MRDTKKRMLIRYPRPTIAAEPTPTACSGKSYAIQAGDDCYSISKSQGIGTGWLLDDNQLQAYCAEFPTSGNLCLTNTCRVYTVQTNDTCKSIAAAHNVTIPQVVAWNPVLDNSCFNLAKMNGSQVCIRSPGRPYVTPTVDLAAPTIAITAAPVPTDVASGVNPRCGKYYHVVTGDYCNMIVIKFHITMDDFIFLNPAINSNCTNLFADESYCVQALGDINTYSGRAGYSTPTTQGPVTGKYSDLPDATYISPTATSTSKPFANGTRTDCNNYFDGDVFQSDITGTNWKSQCLGDTNSSTCSFQPGVQYCGKMYFGSAPVSIEIGPDLPIRDGATPNCTRFVDIEEGWICEDILTVYGLTIAQFFAYNSAVKADCSGLWLGYQYCIRAPGYGASTTSGSPTSITSDVGSPPPTPTSPVQTGQPSDCVKWYTIQSGDSCGSVENAYFLTHAQFRAWNPSVSEDCSTGFWLGYDYCVGIASASTTRSSSSQGPTSTMASVPAPTPNQAGNAISNCNKYAAAQAGDYCS
ncbi:MAG: hypothetical protein Q9196_002579, partial [Gyalolechia fulgens]